MFVQIFFQGACTIQRATQGGARGQPGKNGDGPATCCYSAQQRFVDAPGVLGSAGIQVLTPFSCRCSPRTLMKSIFCPGQVQMFQRLGVQVEMFSSQDSDHPDA
jgi:hypothetical protein